MLGSAALSTDATPAMSPPPPTGTSTTSSCPRRLSASSSSASVPWPAITATSLYGEMYGAPDDSAAVRAAISAYGRARGALHVAPRAARR